MHRKERSLIGNAYVFYFISLIIIPAGFLTRLLYSRTISVADFGTIYAVINFVLILSLVGEMGSHLALFHYIPKFLAQNDYTSSRNICYYSIITKIIMTSIIGFIAYFCSGWLAEHYFETSISKIMLPIFLSYLLFTILQSTSSQILSAHKKQVAGKYLDLFQSGTVLLLSFGFFLIKPENLTISYAAAWAIGTGAIFIISFIVLFKKLPYLRKKPTLDKPLLKRFIGYSLINMGNQVGQKILKHIDILIITGILTTTQVSYYSNAFSLVSIIVGQLSAITLFIMPLASELYQKKNFASLRKMMSVLYSIALYLALPLFLFLVLFSSAILSVIFGPEYRAGSAALAILSGFAIFQIFSTYMTAILNGMGKAKTVFYIVMPSLLVNLTLNFILIKPMGIAGVAIATATSWMVATIASSRIIAKEVGQIVDWKRLGKTAIIALAYVGIIYILKNVIQGNLFIRAAVILVIALGVYYMSGYFLKIFRFQDIYALTPKGIQMRIKRFHQKWFPMLK